MRVTEEVTLSRGASKAYPACQTARLTTGHRTLDGGVGHVEPGRTDSVRGVERPPSVDALARALRADLGLAAVPRSVLVEAARHGIAADRSDPAPHANRYAAAFAERLLRPVINATGVLLHTNLGRAPLGKGSGVDGNGGPAVRSTNLEFDLATGKRGSRRTHASELITQLTGAESSLVVNNCAAAVMLVLAALARGRGVVVSRGELVEIGGGFRIPEVLEQSGAALVEVGTTNRTRLSDYAAAVADPASDIAIILKVHQSNYRITGFTQDVGVSALATLGAPVVADIGSGLLDSTTPWLADPQGRIPRLGWLDGEPAARQTLDAGAGLVVFSGDKLLGGPQAGIVAGRRDLVEQCANHPLARALRPGGQVLEALQRVLLAYTGGSTALVPFWDMATRSVGSLTVRAEAVVQAVADERVAGRVMDAVPGGGTLPGCTIPSFGVRIAGDWTVRLRAYETPVVARVQNGATHLDLRTVDPLDDELLIDALRLALAN